jgi:replicative DNA helicase
MNIPELDLTILKHIISNKKHAVDFANDCETKLFSPEIWNAANIIVGYIRTYKDVPTKRVVIERLSKGNNEKLIDHVKTVWDQLEKTTVTDSEYKHELEKFKRRFAEKEITTFKSTLDKFQPGTMDISKATSELQKTLQSIRSLNQVKAYERKTLKDAVPIFRDEYNAKINDPNFDRGIKTGYSYLDYVTDGLRPGELLLIGAESGAGKSMLLMNMAIQMWLQNNDINAKSGFSPGNHILYFSLEMPFKPCLNRVLARLSSNSSKKIRNATLDNEEALKLKKVLKFIKNYPYEFEIIDIPRGATMESLELIYEDVKTHYDPKIIVIDYLGLMAYEGADMEDWLKLGKIAEKIHEFARVHNCIVLSAVQLNRAKPTKDAEEKIGLHRVGRSALILQNANIAIQIETRPKEKDYPDMIYHLIKNRDGELGKGRLIKNLANGTLLDEKIDEDTTEFIMRDPDDISDKAALLDI